MPGEFSSTGQTEDGRMPAAPVRLIHPVDTVIAAMIFALCGWLFYETLNFDSVSALFSQNIPPGLFPQILLIVICILSAGMPFEHILLRRKGKDIDKTRRDRVKPVTWITMALLLAITASAPIFGTFLTMVLVCAVLPLAWGERRLHYVLVFALSFPAAVAFVFSGILGVYFEPGLIGLSFH